MPEKRITERSRDVRVIDHSGLLARAAGEASIAGPIGIPAERWRSGKFTCRTNRRPTLCGRRLRRLWGESLHHRGWHGCARAGPGSREMVVRWARSRRRRRRWRGGGGGGHGGREGGRGGEDGWARRRGGGHVGWIKEVLVGDTMGLRIERATGGRGAA